MKEKMKKMFILETNESLANAIRRSVDQIPIVAIDSVEIYKNDSALYDEILSHRVGLIPVKSNRKIEEIKEGEKPTQKNQIQVTLKAKGPTTVYSKDLKGDIEEIYSDIPIVILDKDQELELIGFIQSGRGTNHAKFSPGLVYYRNSTKLKIKKADKINENSSILKNKILKGKLPVKAGDEIVINEDQDFVESLIKEGNDIEVSHGNEILFFIESWGQISEKEIFQEAVKALNKNLNEILKLVK